METFLLDYAQYGVGLIMVLGGVYVAYVQKKRSPHETIATGTEAIENLMVSLKELTLLYNKERAERLSDCIKFERGLVDLRKELTDYYDEKTKEDLFQQKEDYEIIIKRLKQGYSDQIKALKLRILELEAKVNGGKCQI